MGFLKNLLKNMINFLYHKIRFLIRANKYKNTFDPEEIQYILEKMKEGDVAFDIGAHKGAYTYWIRKKVGNMSKILAIEPQPLLFDYLETVKDLFGWDNVILMDCAVSDKDTEGVITVPGKPGEISQGARIDDQGIIHEKQACHEIKVRIRSIDSLVQETGLKPRLVKIDVEGHEFSVLRGMEETLKSIKPLIILECEARHIKDFTVFDVFNFLIERGYKGFYLKEGKKNRIETYDIEKEQLSYFKENKRLDYNYINNFIFEPEEEVEKF